MKQIAIIGCSGAIGSALMDAYANRFPQAHLYGFCRQPQLYQGPETSTIHGFDGQQEDTIAQAAQLACQHGPLDRVIVATGMLHGQQIEQLATAEKSPQLTIQPEKSLQALSTTQFQQLYWVNAILPALIAKHFLPQLNKQQPAVFAALSARVGSISDNRRGGWYAYRASKAALNMILKNAAIEIQRRNPQAIVVGLHPGTVDSPLSAPFQKNVPADKLFTPAYCASQLIEVIESRTPSHSGDCFAWDGQPIAP